MKPQHAEVVSLIKRGKTHSQIATLLGVSRPRVSQIVRQMSDSGVDTKRPTSDLPPDVRWASVANSVAQSVMERMGAPIGRIQTDVPECPLSGVPLSSESKRDFPAMLPLFPESGYTDDTIIVHPVVAAFFAKFTPEQAVGILRAYVALRNQASQSTQGESK